jgi:hypothetical protein
MFLRNHNDLIVYGPALLSNVFTHVFSNYVSIIYFVQGPLQGIGFIRTEKERDSCVRVQCLNKQGQSHPI